MEKLINYKSIKLQPLYYSTKISINNKIPNLNKWVGLNNNNISLFYNDHISELHLSYPKNNISISKKEEQLSYLKIDKFILVINITNSTSLFTAFLYQNFINDSNIQHYLNVDKSLLTLGKYLYDNIYSSSLLLDNASFTDRFIKHIPLTLIQTDTLYYYDQNYDADTCYNCFRFKNHNTDVKKIQTNEFYYQSFSEKSIWWFFDKIYKKQLHRYFKTSMIISTKNRILNYNYIFLNDELQRCIQIYYEWFQTSNNYNLDLKTFTIFIYSYYFIKLNQSFTIFYDFYMLSQFDNSVSIYSNQILVGLYYDGKSIHSFNDFINKLYNNKYNIDCIIPLDDTLTDKIVLLTDISEIIYDNEYILLPKNYDNFNDIIDIKTKISCNNIFIFESLHQFNRYRNILISLPQKTCKFTIKSDSFYRIVNEFKNHHYTHENADRYIFKYDKQKLDILVEKDFDEYKSEVLSIIDNYINNKIIITYLIDNIEIMIKFINFYIDKNPIIIINILNIKNCNFPSYYNIIIVKYFPEIMNFDRRFEFINPNFFISELGYYTYQKINFTSDKKKIYGGLYLMNDNINKSKIPEIIVEDMHLKLKDKIKIKNLSYRFDV